MEKVVLGTVALVSAVAPVIIGISNSSPLLAQFATDWQARAGGKMAFEVASVKPSKGAVKPSNLKLTPWDDYNATNGGFRADETLAVYIEFAYKLWPNELQSREFSHLPRWVATDRYSVEAEMQQPISLRISSVSWCNPCLLIVSTSRPILRPERLPCLSSSLQKPASWDQNSFLKSGEAIRELIGSDLSSPRVRYHPASSALLLAAIGIYGLIAYSMAQRTREIEFRDGRARLRVRVAPG